MPLCFGKLLAVKELMCSNHTLSDKEMLDLFFVGLNYSSDKISVTSEKFCHFCLTKNAKTGNAKIVTPEE